MAQKRIISTHPYLSILMSSGLLLVSACSSGDPNEGANEDRGTGESSDGLGSTGGSQPGSSEGAASGGGFASGGNGAGAGDAGSGGSDSGDSDSAAGGEPGTGGEPSGGEVVPDLPYCEGTKGWDAEWARMEQEILDLVNEERSRGANCGGEMMPPVGPLTMDAELQCAARMHSLDMAMQGYFSHNSPDGKGPKFRMDEAGYEGRTWGENIAAGSRNAEGTMNQWMNSPGHCSNLMSGSFAHIGVGYYPGGEYGHLWTQTFGNK